MTQKPQDDKPEFFVSRRGRQVGLHEVNLSGIDVETDEAAKLPATKPQAPRPKQKSAKQPRSNRRRALIIGVVAALLLLPVAAAELIAAQYRSGGASARADLSGLVQREVLPLQKKQSITADQLRQVATEVDSIGARMCRGGLLDNAATLYPRAKHALDQCKASQRGVAALSLALFQFESQARYLERLGVIIQPVTEPITDEFAVVSAQQKAWQAAADSLTKLSPPTAMNAAHTEVLTHVKAVAAGWADLNTANNNQDADAFTAAEKKLSIEYEAVRSSSDQLDAVLRDTQARVLSAYASLK